MLANGRRRQNQIMKLMVGNEEHTESQAVDRALQSIFERSPRKGKEISGNGVIGGTGDDSRTTNERGVKFLKRGGPGRNQRVNWGGIPWANIGTLRIWLSQM